VLIGTYRQGRDGVTIRALADHTQLAATHVTTEVGRLTEKGLLTKSANAHDRRSVLVRLSPSGEAAVRAINPLLRRVNDQLFQNVSRQEFAVVSRFCRLRSTAIHAGRGPAPERERSTRGRWPRTDGRD
jgi:DNA-binding MarR family transcriptional regulator